MSKGWNEFNIGDIITTYHKGFWRLTGIKRRHLTKDDLRYENDNAKVGDEYSPVFSYEQVLTGDFEKPRGIRKGQCDALYCHKIDKEFVDKELQRQKERLKRLKDLLNG